MGILHDVRFGFRMLLKSPLLTFAAIVCLGLGIGASTTIFSMVNSVMIRPIPLDESRNLYQVRGGAFDNTEFSLSLPNYHDLREQLSRERDGRTFETLAIFDDDSFNIGRGMRAERVQGVTMSANMLDVLRVKPLLGRPFTVEEDRPGAPLAILISKKLWERKFDANPDVIGQEVPLQGETATIVGVMPDGFHFPLFSDVFAPFRRDYPNENRGSNWVTGLARLAEDVTAEQAKSEIEAISAALAKEHNQNRGKWRAKLKPFLEYYLPGDLRVMFVVFPIAVLLVMLIACVNVANLLYAKGVERQREIAIRSALGASRGRVVRLLLTESILLALIGAGAGALIALWGIDLMMAAVQTPIPYWIKMDVDGLVLGFTVLLAVVAGLASGAMPALQLSRTDLTTSLKDAGAATTAGRSRHLLRNSLMVAQITAAVTLLILSGVMIQNLLRLQSVDPGFDPKNLLTARIELPHTDYDSTEKIRNFVRASLASIETIPGVEDATMCGRLPMAGGSSSLTFTVEGAPPVADHETWPWGFYKYVGADYFRVLGIPIKKGRSFDERDTDRPDAERLAIINEALAERYWKNEDPVGKRFFLGSSRNNPVKICAVVGNVKYKEIGEPTKPILYLFNSQRASSFVSFAVRTDGPPLALASALRAKVQSIDPNLPLHQVRSMDEIVRKSMWTKEFMAQVLGVLGAVALFLAALGLYGVIAFGVSQRTHEIGIRMALGARARDVVTLVVRQGIVLVVIGIGVGLAFSYALTEVLSAFLARIDADAIPFVLVPLVILAVALIATWLPARRATRIEPMTALRFE